MTGPQRSRSRIARWTLGLLGLALLADTLVLLALRKINTGTLLPGVLGMALLAGVWGEAHIRRWRAHPLFNRLWQAGRLIAALGLASWIVFVGVLCAQPNPPLAGTPQAIIVLGAGLRGAEPSPTLAMRLAVAAELARQYPESPVVVSGGQGFSEASTEALAMQRSLLAQGIAPGRVVLEPRATRTEENLHFSAALLRARGIAPDTAALAIVTSDFHAPRTRRLARAAGFGRATVVTAPTPRAILLNVWLREYLAWIKAGLAGEL